MRKRPEPGSNGPGASASPPPSPPHATLWRSEGGFLAAHAVVRLRRDDGGYAVERYDVSGGGSWPPPSRIFRAHRVVAGALAPIP